MLETFAVSSDTPAENAHLVAPLFQSSNTFRIPIRFIWTGKPYTNSYDLKLVKVLECLKASSSTYAMYLDAFDTMFVRPMEELIETFLSFERHIVMGTERSGDHEYAYGFTYPGPYRFLNAGCFIGVRRALIESIESILENESFHSITNFRDQPMWIRHYLEHQDMIALDHDCRLFQTVTPNYKPTGLCKKNNQVTCSFSGSNPFILHAQSAKYLDPQSKLIPELMEFLNDPNAKEFNPDFDHVVDEKPVIEFEEL